HGRGARGGRPEPPPRAVPPPRARARARPAVRGAGPRRAPARPLSSEGAGGHGAHGGRPALGGVRGDRGRLGVLRDGGIVRLRARALRHLGGARQSPAAFTAGASRTRRSWRPASPAVSRSSTSRGAAIS